MKEMSPEEWAEFLETVDEQLQVPTKEKFRMLLFGALLQNNVGWWNEIRFTIFPKVLDSHGSGEGSEDIPDQYWEGWQKVAKAAGLISRWHEWRRAKDPFPWGILSLFISENTASVTEAPGKDIPMSKFFPDEESPQDQDTDSDGAGLCGLIPREPIPISIVGKTTKKRRKGKQEVVYEVDFEGYDEDERSWFPAATLRKKHPHGAAVIREYEEKEKQARSEEAKRKKEQETKKKLLEALEGTEKRGAKKGKARKGALSTALNYLDKEETDDDDTDSDTYQSQLEFEPEPKRRQRGRKGRPLSHKVKESFEEKENQGLNFFQALAAHVNQGENITPRKKSINSHKEDNARTTSRISKDARDTEVLRSGRRANVPSTHRGNKSKYYDGVEIEDISSSDDHNDDHLMIKLKWPDGSSKTLTHEEAHSIPEIAKKLLDSYAKRILGFRLLRHLL